MENNLFQSELNNIINLNKIDWIELERVCFKSIMVNVCEYKRNHPDTFAKDVAKIFDISVSSVRNYWKRGTVLGLCQYDSAEEGHRWNLLEHERKQSVPIYVENLDTSENWMFKSKTDFCKHSKDILDGDLITKSKLEKRFNKTKDNFIIYDSGLSEYLIWAIRR